MAGKNKKKAGLPTFGLMSVALACLFFGGAGLGYLWNKQQIAKLGQQIHGYEVRLEEARRRRFYLDRTYAERTSQEGLEDLVRRSHLDMGQAQINQLVRLPEAPLTPATEEKLVARRAGEEGRN